MIEAYQGIVGNFVHFSPDAFRKGSDRSDLLTRIMLDSTQHT